ncbi:MAG TPA: amidohydrolase family protein [Dehalococcoidales bacterium]|nr:amidohydrolase family protein [Dehalococcoidales bacterium]
MTVDFHTHVFPPQIKKNRGQYIDRDPCFAILYSNPEAKIATAEELIAEMDKTGIDISVILNIGWTTHELCVETNDYIIDAVSRYPKRLVGFGAVQPQSTKAAVAEIERCAGAGLRGIGEIRPDLQLFDFADETVMTPFVEALQQHNLILLTHASEPVGHSYPGKGGITPDVLYPFITSYPDLTIVCAHWGGGLPFYSLMPEVKEAMKNVYFDTAASPFLYSPDVYSQGIRLAGADKILFGSDYPLLPPRRLLEEIKALDMNRETKDLMLSGNALRLLGIKNES